MKTKYRTSGVYLGFPNNNLRWAVSGWPTLSYVPSIYKLPRGYTWQQYWDYYYGDDSWAATWQTFGSTVATTAVGLPAETSSTERITYDTGKSRFNFCEHRAFKVYSLPFTLAYGKKPGSNSGAPNYLPFYRVPPIIQGHPFEVVHGASEFAAASRAWYEMQPRFEGEINMTNFLLELGDIKSLMRHGARILVKLQNLPTVAYRTFRAVSRKGADVTRPLSELILEKNLAIDPLLGDLTTIMCQLCESVQEAQRMFKLKGELGMTRHYSEQLSYSDNFPTLADNGLYSVGTRTETRFTATLNMSYDYKLRSASDAFLKYWGLTGSAETLWNALPFSFIVDYFIKVGRALHQMETDPNVRVGVRKYCQSVKTTTTVGQHFTPGSYWTHYKLWIDGGTPSAPGQLLSGCESRLYTRMPCAPNKGAALPRVKIPSGKQMLNMAAITRCMMN